MRGWIVGRCKKEDCKWTSARIKEDKFTSLDVTEDMIEHTKEEGHSCEQHYYNRER